MNFPHARERCIFCLEFFDTLTQEHVIPDAIGGGLKIGALCKACNSYLGSNVDSHLTDLFLVQLRRFDLGLLGRRGYLKHPMAHGVLSDEPYVRARWNIGSREESRVYIEPVIREGKDENGNDVLRIRIDANDRDKLQDMLQKLQTRWRKKGRELNIPDTIPEAQVRPAPEMLFNFSLNLAGLNQAIFKIFYEAAYIAIGSEFIESDLALKLRKLIFNKNLTLEDIKEAKVRGSVNIMTEDIDMFTFIDTPDHLIAFLGDPIQAIYIRIFDICEAVMPVKDNGIFDGGSIDGSRFLEFDARSKSFEALSLKQIFSKYLKGV